MCRFSGIELIIFWNQVDHFKILCRKFRRRYGIFLVDEKVWIGNSKIHLILAQLNSRGMCVGSDIWAGELELGMGWSCRIFPGPMVTALVFGESSGGGMGWEGSEARVRWCVWALFSSAGPFVVGGCLGLKAVI